MWWQSWISGVIAPVSSQHVFEILYLLIILMQLMLKVLISLKKIILLYPSFLMVAYI